MRACSEVGCRAFSFCRHDARCPAAAPLVQASRFTVHISDITASFYKKTNPSATTWDTASTATPVLVTKVPAVAFNATSQVSCSSKTGVSSTTRPVTNVVPKADGSCTLSALTNLGKTVKVGEGDLNTFDAALTGYLYVSAAGQVTFKVSADDGDAFGIGKNFRRAQPSDASGSIGNAPSATTFRRYPVVGAYYIATPLVDSSFTVYFPSPGFYPFELDYFQVNLNSSIGLVLKANGSLLQQGVPAVGSK